MEDDNACGVSASYVGWACVSWAYLFGLKGITPASTITSTISTKALPTAICDCEQAYDVMNWCYAGLCHMNAMHSDTAMATMAVMVMKKIHAS